MFTFSARDMATISSCQRVGVVGYGHLGQNYRFADSYPHESFLFSSVVFLNLRAVCVCVCFRAVPGGEDP